MTFQTSIASNIIAGCRASFGAGRMRNYIFATAGATLVLGAANAMAADPNVSICKAYARAAIVQYDEMKKLGCGFTGPRWSYEYENHYDYCIGSYQADPNFDVTPERTARKQQLAECKASKASTQSQPKAKKPIGKVNADVDLYDQPGGDGNVIGMWPAGANLRYDCNEDNWCKVQGGWIYGSFLDR